VFRHHRGPSRLTNRLCIHVFVARRSYAARRAAGHYERIADPLALPLKRKHVRRPLCIDKRRRRN
jgi:hypothetical protein